MLGKDLEGCSSENLVPALDPTLHQALIPQNGPILSPSLDFHLFPGYLTICDEILVYSGVMWRGIFYCLSCSCPLYCKHARVKFNELTSYAVVFQLWILFANIWIKLILSASCHCCLLTNSDLIIAQCGWIYSCLKIWNFTLHYMEETSCLTTTQFGIWYQVVQKLTCIVSSCNRSSWRQSKPVNSDEQNFQYWQSAIHLGLLSTNLICPEILFKSIISSNWV